MVDLFHRLSLYWVPVLVVVLFDPHVIFAQLPKLTDTKFDTCLVWTDSTAQKVTTFAATRSVRTYQERPAELGPIAPVRVSPRSCTAFLGLPSIPLLGGWQKDRCSAFSFTFASPGATDTIKRFSPPEKRWTDNSATNSPARPGDTILLTVSTVGDRPLRRMLLRAGGEILAAVDGGNTMQFTYLVPDTPGGIELFLQAQRRLFVFPVKQFATISVVRKPRPYQVYDPPLRANRLALDSVVSRVELDTVGKVRSSILRLAALRQDSTSIFTLREEATLGPQPTLRLDTLSRQSCPGSYAFSRIRELGARPAWLVQDTLLFQAANETRTVVGLRNPLGTHGVTLPVRIPKRIRQKAPDIRDSLFAVAYWIGAGEESLTEYVALSEEIPPAWTQPGVSAPLAAFGAGHPVILPAVRSPGGMASRYGLTYHLREETAGTLITSSENDPPFGLLAGKALDALTREGDLHLTLSVENRHESNSYQLQLQVVAFYQTEGQGIRWVSIHP